MALTCSDVVVLPMLSTAGASPAERRINIVKGYVARKGDRYYAIIYEGIDPITGRERRRWHPAGSCRLKPQYGTARTKNNR